MNTFEILLVLHLLAVAVWLGGSFTGLLLGSQLRKSGDAGPMASYCAAFARIGGPLFGGSSMITLLTGVGMVALDGGPEFGHLWVQIGIVGWLLSAVFGATIVGKSWYRIGEELAAPGATLEASQALIAKAVNVTWLDMAFRSLLVIVMVWRPT